MEEAPPVQEFIPSSSNVDQSNFINNSFSVQPNNSKLMNMTKDYLPDRVKIGGNEFELEELFSKAEISISYTENIRFESWTIVQKTCVLR